ncbi:MAG TPA: DNA-directed RNA polymerase subunit alpha [Dehalococcoidia bacterium]|nr:DNA-directed RNA polymerase subunit alpha [Dehalococcoidia bacterium]
MAADLLIPELTIEAQEDDYARVIAEPLESGFGTTVGNALRRVLLSSLPGAAITSVRIEGVDHEFSTLEHMQQDVTEFLLNLKEVRLRAFSDRPARLYLEASGAGEVTAGQIQATADYEIVNGDQPLALLDHKDGSLVVDINVESGRGYLPATVSEGLPIGVIPVDAVFTPVRRVNYKVSKTRVGQDTDFDRLELEIWTDGTIDGEAATSMAAEVLREQLTPFFRLGRPDVPVVEEAPASLVQQPADGHDMPIETLNLSVRAYNCLKRSGLTTVGLVLEKSEEELLALRNFGEKSYEELRDRLVEEGFTAPRIDSRRSGVPAGVAAGEPAATATADAAPEAATEADDGGNGESVSALGQALIEALKEAGEDPSELVQDES